MVEDDDGLTFVHLRCDLTRRFAHLDAAAGTVRVRAAVEVEFPVNERSLIVQERNVRLLQKLVHARVALLLLAPAEGEARKHRFLNVVVAVAGVNAVFRADTAQRFRDAIRVVHRLPLIVENIPCNDDKIGVLFVDLLHHSLHLLFADVVAEVQIRHEHDLHLVHARNTFVDRHVIGCYMNDTRIDNAPERRSQDGKRAKAARDAVHLRRDKNVLERQCIPEQQPQKIRRNNREQHIQQHAQPVVADELHHTPRPALGQEKSDDDGADQKHLHRNGQRPMAHRSKKREPRLHPPHRAAQQIVIRQQIDRRK